MVSQSEVPETDENMGYITLIWQKSWENVEPSWIKEILTRIQTQMTCVSSLVNSDRIISDCHIHKGEHKKCVKCVEDKNKSRDQVCDKSSTKGIVDHHDG